MHLDAKNTSISYNGRVTEGKVWSSAEGWEKDAEGERKMYTFTKSVVLLYTSTSLEWKKMLNII